MNQEEKFVTGDEEERDWVAIYDPALVAGLDQLAAYIEEHGRFEWTNPSLTHEEAAEAQRMADDALRRLRENNPN